MSECLFIAECLRFKTFTGEVVSLAVILVANV